MVPFLRSALEIIYNNTIVRLVFIATRISDSYVSYPYTSR